MDASNEGERIGAFPALNAFVEQEEFDIKSVCGIFLEHLTSFLSVLDRYIPFQDFCKAFNWMRIPFEAAALQDHPEIGCVGEQLVVLQSRQLWNEKHKNLSMTQFWASVQSMEPNVSKLCWQETKAFLPFPFTYLCEAGCSALAMVKIKYRYQLQPEEDLRCALTTIKPILINLCSEFRDKVENLIT